MNLAHLHVPSVGWVPRANIILLVTIARSGDRWHAANNELCVTHWLQPISSVALDFWFYSSEPQFLIYWRVLIIMPVWQGFHKRLNLLSHAFSTWWPVVSTQFMAGESQSSRAESLWEARLEFSGPGSAFPAMLHPAQWDIRRCQSQSILDTSAFLPILVDNSGCVGRYLFGHCDKIPDKANLIFILAMVSAYNRFASLLWACGKVWEYDRTKVLSLACLESRRQEGAGNKVPRDMP